MALAAAGRLHEQKVIQHLQSLVKHPSPLCTIPFAHPERHELTRKAVQDRVPLIRGAALRDDKLDGYADVLIRADLDPFLPQHMRERLHPLAYSVCEIKFATNQTPDHILQTASYFSLLNNLLHDIGCDSGASGAYLWLGSENSEPVRLPSRPLVFLYQNTLFDYVKYLRDFPELKSPPLPDSSLPNLSPWSCVAEKFLLDTDSLCLIAGITRVMAKTISRSTNLSTLTQFSSLSQKAVTSLVSKGNLPLTSIRLHKQASMQAQTRLNPDCRIAFEIIKNSGRTLPKPSPQDIYFDIEGYPLVPQGGLEYLFGALCTRTEEFVTWWAHSREQEEEAFIRLVDWVQKRITLNSTIQPHIYHYGHYEIVALSRVASRVKTPLGMHAAITFENIVELGYFFDVYKFVKAAVVIGDSSYSIKTVEKLAGVIRDDDDLVDAQSSVGLYFEWRRSSLDNECNIGVAADENSHPMLNEIFVYNRRDCQSLEQVVDWLRDRVPLIKNSDINNISRDGENSNTSSSSSGSVDQESKEDLFMPGSCGRTLELRLADSEAIRRGLELSEVLLKKGSSVLEKPAALCLAHILQYYVRESSPDRRVFRERVEIASTTSYDDLFNDEKCIVGVRFVGSVKQPESRNGIIHAYEFNISQATTLTETNRVAFVVPSSKRSSDRDSQRTIAGFFSIKGIVDNGNGKCCAYISGGTKSNITPPKFGVLVSADDLTICDGPLRQSVLRRAEELVSSNGPIQMSSLTKSFLNRETAVEDDQTDAKWLRLFADGVSDRETISAFLGSRRKPRAFVMQGPPGTGKTRLSGQLISDLVTKYNLTVSVTSNSHAAIDNLLCSVVEAGVNPDLVWKVGTRTADDFGVGFKSNVRDISVSPLTQTKTDNENNGMTDDGNGGSNDDQKILQSKKKNRRKYHGAVVGATCYQLCREENEGTFDVLFVDEASQVPMAHVVAVSGCARYVVLVGDQQQLEMPVKGAHLGGTGQSCLGYVVGEGVVTVEAQRGIFLNTSYRMNEKLCSFVSNSFYDGALQAADSCHGNYVETGGVDCRKSGIWFIPCEAEEESTSKMDSSKWHRAAEVEVIRKTINALIGAEFVVHGVKRELKETDLMVVAPYNAQVRSIRDAVGRGIRVGTVDKFQGQQAAVALISTCTSGDFGEDMTSEDELDDVGRARQHRGLRFCLQKNRLNVAISRAQCVAIVTGGRDAWTKLPLNKLEDIEMAALYQDLVECGE